MYTIVLIDLELLESSFQLGIIRIQTVCLKNETALVYIVILPIVKITWPATRANHTC